MLSQTFYSNSYLNPLTTDNAYWYGLSRMPVNLNQNSINNLSWKNNKPLQSSVWKCLMKSFYNIFKIFLKNNKVSKHTTFAMHKRISRYITAYQQCKPTGIYQSKTELMWLSTWSMTRQILFLPKYFTRSIKQKRALNFLTLSLTERK